MCVWLRWFRKLEYVGEKDTSQFISKWIFKEGHAFQTAIARHSRRNPSLWKPVWRNFVWTQHHGRWSVGPCTGTLRTHYRCPYRDTFSLLLSATSTTWQNNSLHSLTLSTEVKNPGRRHISSVTRIQLCSRVKSLLPSECDLSSSNAIIEFVFSEYLFILYNILVIGSSLD